jgi:ADP-heptose:LPS heptosyltransferase
MNKNNSKILVIKLGALGDFIQAFGPIAAIRKHHPNSKITLLTTEPFLKLAEKSNYFDDIKIDKKPKWYDLKGWLSLKTFLQNENFERVYDLQNNDRTSIYFSLINKNKKPEWVGIAKGASHQNLSPKRTSGHAFDGHVQTLKLAGIKDVNIDDLSWINEDVSHFKLPDSYGLIVPGCSPKRPEKKWPDTSYGQIANYLEKNGITPIIIGSGFEEKEANKIAAICPKAINLINKTSLFEIVSIAQNAKISIGNDTGPMHMIGLTGCPSLVLFSSSSNPKKHAPKGDKISVLQEDNLKNLTSSAVEKEISKILK